MLPKTLLLLLGFTALLSAESLWTSETLSDGTLYTDQVARRRGDLITILVQETTAISATQKTETKRSLSADASGSVAAGISGTPAVTGSATTLPTLALDSSKNFKGEGKVEQAGSVKATVTGRVMDVLDNGNLVVEGRRAVKVNDDTKTILITGIIRTADIRSDNTVLSEKLHNFQVAIEGDGPLARSQGPGFFGKVLDVVWPF